MSTHRTASSAVLNVPVDAGGHLIQTLARVKRASKTRERSSLEWRASIVAAHTAGESLRAIAGCAGVSHVRVLQIVRGH